ncbi:MAG: nucleoside recognition domain-containing protein [Acutalibacteraceae bacterium]|jgi:spore maturation protein B|nr:spore maturation protein [Clostridiales bacterium]
MAVVGAWVLPSMIFSIIVFGLFKGVNVFECFVDGAKGGMKTLVGIMPSLIGLILAVTMLRSSGALDILSWLMSPISKLTGIPDEVVPLAVLSPISGSGALSMYESMLNKYGVDNNIERVASIIMGSSETTFYAITLYYGAVDVKKTRHTVPSALSADLTSFIMSSWIVRLMF